MLMRFDGASHVLDERRPRLIDGREEPMPALFGQRGGAAEQFHRGGVGQRDDGRIDGVMAVVAAVLFVRIAVGQNAFRPHSSRR